MAVKQLLSGEFWVDSEAPQLAILMSATPFRSRAQFVNLLRLLTHGVERPGKSEFSAYDAHVQARDLRHMLQDEQTAASVVWRRQSDEGVRSWSGNRIFPNLTVVRPHKVLDNDFNTPCLPQPSDQFLDLLSLVTLDEDRIKRVVEVAMRATAGEWIPVEDYASVRKSASGEAAPHAFDGTGADVIIAGTRVVQPGPTSVVIRWNDDDCRAKRTFSGEYHHFSASVANILVVDACAVGGVEDWAKLMAPLFQPGRNRKVGAIALFQQGLLGPPEAIRRRWYILRNPHAHLPVPESLLEGIESLTDPMWYSEASDAKKTTVPWMSSLSSIRPTGTRRQYRSTNGCGWSSKYPPGLMQFARTPCLP